MDQYSEKASKAPDINRLVADWQHCVDDRDPKVYRNLRHNVETRGCYWPGQTEDGRRWWKAPGADDVFPWPGAADSRVPLADLYVRSDTALLMTVWRRNKIRIQGTEVNDDKWAARMTQVLRWMRYTQMREYKTEARLLANYFLERGGGVMGVWWSEQEQMGYEQLSLDRFQAIAQQAEIAHQQRMDDLLPGVANEQLAQLMQILQDPTREDEAIELGEMLYPRTPITAMRRALAELRKTGMSQLPRPYVRESRPRVCALALNEDIFISPEACDIDESCPSVHWREIVTETTLRQRIRSMDWNEQWVENVIETQRGVMTGGLDGVTSGWGSGSASKGSMAMVDTSKVFEIIHSYRREYNEDDVPMINCTVWHQGITGGSNEKTAPEVYGSHQQFEHEDGEMPFVLARREMRSRNIDDSRGVPQVASTWQQAIKGSWDSRRDRNSIATLPPSYHPPGKRPDDWGPGAQVATTMPERYGFFKGPSWDPGEREMEGTIQHFADRYMGRVLPDGTNKVEAGSISQDLADTWMEVFEKVDTKVMKLCQQYMSDEFFYRIVGEGQGKAVKTTRDEIQGQFDVFITYEVSNLNSDNAKEKIGLMETAIQMDNKGAIDRVRAVEAVFDLVDPGLGERLIRPEQEAADAEIADERNVFAQIFAGLPVDVKPGQDYRGRLEWLKQMMQQNPVAQQRYKDDPQFRDLLERRGKQLMFQIQQQQNAQIGRTGAA